KSCVLPKVTKHFQQVRFAASEKATDPSAFLARPPLIVEESPDDFLNAIGKLPFADECRKLTAKLQQFFLTGPVGNAGLALIHKAMSGWIALQNLADLLHTVAPSPCSVMGIAM